jgi:hypothetical protein
MSNETNSSVSLGCGTLILIAIIVAIFSNGSDISSDIQNLRSEVRELAQEVKDLRTVIEVRDAEQPIPK